MARSKNGNRCNDPVNELRDEPSCHRESVCWQRMPLRRLVNDKWCPKLTFHWPPLTKYSPTICVQHRFFLQHMYLIKRVNQLEEENVVQGRRVIARARLAFIKQGQRRGAAKARAHGVKEKAKKRLANEEANEKEYDQESQVFFFSSLLFSRESLTRTVLLVSLQAAGAP